MEEFTTDRGRQGSPRLLPGQRTADRSVFAWEADDGRGRRVCGITDDPTRAVQGLRDAVQAMPGASGTVRPARLDTNAPAGPAYIYGPPMLSARRETPTGTLVFDAPG